MEVTALERDMLPLTGVKVIELTNNIAGPYAGYILALLGADELSGVRSRRRPSSGGGRRRK